MNNDRCINNLSTILYHISNNKAAQSILDGLLWHIGTGEIVGDGWLEGMLDALWYALDMTCEDMHMSLSFFKQTLRYALTDECTD